MELDDIEVGGEDHRQLREHARRYFSTLMTPALRAELDAEDRSPHSSTPGTSARRRVARQIGMDRWLAIGAPVDHGGIQGTFVDRVVIVQEAERSGAPFPFLTTLSILPALDSFGTVEQKNALIPKMISGDLLMALGYTEPDAGTDLSALRTRAEPRTNGYLVNGSKVFTSEADIADFILLAARTDPEAPPTKGISLLLVPTTAPGFSCTALPTIGDYRTTTTYFDDVFVPAGMLLGPEHEGWRVIMSQLNLERIAMAVRISTAADMVGEVRDWLGHVPDQAGRQLLHRSTVQRCLAEATVETIAARALIAYLMGDGHSATAEAASAMKVFASESALRSTRVLMQACGELASLTGDDATAPIRGRLEHTYRRAIIDTFGGGANEIQRELIATRALALPRSR